MDELKNLLKDKIELCATSINARTPSDVDVREAEAIEHLARALSYINQIEEREVN